MDESARRRGLRRPGASRLEVAAPSFRRPALFLVTPAKAVVHSAAVRTWAAAAWIPAFAGMTKQLTDSFTRFRGNDGQELSMTRLPR